MLEKNSAEELLDIAIQGCIRKLERILEQHPDKKHIQQFRDVKERYGDPELKLAVIGEFNTGKSTFINALLGKDFLSTENVPTTVIPTYIRWNGQNVNAPTIKLRFANDDREYDVEEHRVFLEGKLGFPLGREDDFERITTNNDLIGIVSHVSASFPRDERFENFCLIDTPGSNPGAEETKEHANITREILREEADATIILFPANVTGNRSALEFISENASHLLNGAEFVITKKDMIDTDREMEKIIKYLKGLVKQRYELEDQTVYTCSARNALRAIAAGEAEDPFLQDFDTMVVNILTDLGKKRKQLIFRKVSALLQALLTDLKQEQNALSQKLEQEAKVLEQYSLENLEKAYILLSSKFRWDLNGEVTKRISNIKYQVTSKTNYIVDRVEADLQSKNSVWAVGDYGSNGVKPRLSEFEESIKKGICADINQLEQIYKDFSKRVFECLKEYELQISTALKQNVETKAEVSTPGVAMDVSFDSVVGGLGLGALILLFVNPAVLVGVAVAGFVFGDALTRQMKKKLLSKLESGLKKAGNGIEEKWNGALAETKALCLRSAETLMKDYKDRYSAVFQARVVEDEKEKERIRLAISKVGVSLRDIDIMETALELPMQLGMQDEIPKELLQNAACGDISFIKRVAGMYKAWHTVRGTDREYNNYLKWSAFAQLCADD